MKTMKIIDELCNEKGITRRQAELQSGLSIGTFSKWSSGKIQPSQSSLQKLSEFFGVDKAYITGESEIRNLKGVMVAALMQQSPEIKSVPKRKLVPSKSFDHEVTTKRKFPKPKLNNQKFQPIKVEIQPPIQGNLNVGCKIPIINRLPVSQDDTFTPKEQIGSELISPDYPAGKYFAVKLPEDAKGLADKGDLIIMMKATESNHNGLVLIKNHGFCTINKLNDTVFVIIPCDKSKKPIVKIKTEKIDIIAVVIEIRKKLYSGV